MGVAGTKLLNSKREGKDEATTGATMGGYRGWGATKVWKVGWTTDWTEGWGTVWSTVLVMVGWTTG